MDATVPWLLLIIAALIVVSISLYSHARQVESHALGRQLLVAEELREAEAALHAALEKLRQMDTALAIREHTLTREGQVLMAMDGRGAPGPSEPGIAAPAAGMGEPGSPEQPDPTVPVSPVLEAPLPVGPVNAGGREFLPAAGRRRSGAARQAAHAQEWAARARELASAGATAGQIARELEVPAGEVELVLALTTRRSPLF